MYRLAALCGAACVALLVLGGRLLPALPEWVGQLVWLGLVVGLSAWCGYRDPRLGWQAGAVVIAIQPVCVLVLAVVTGELAHPSSSTGGAAGVFIVAVLMAILSPIPMLAGQLGSWARKRHDARAQTQIGASR
jgi:hypothetical protein